MKNLLRICHWKSLKDLKSVIERSGISRRLRDLCSRHHLKRCCDLGEILSCSQLPWRRAQRALGLLMIYGVRRWTDNHIVWGLFWHKIIFKILLLFWPSAFEHDVRLSVSSPPIWADNGVSICMRKASDVASALVIICLSKASGATAFVWTKQWTDQRQEGGSSGEAHQHTHSVLFCSILFISLL